MLRFLFWLTLLGIQSTCNTSLTSSSIAQLHSKEQRQQTSSPTWRIDDQGKPRLQARIQESFFAKIMQNKDYLEGYALFSYGGWSNNGQTMVLCKEDDSGDIIHIAPNTSKELATHSFSKASLDRLRSSLRDIDLADFTPKVFDGIEYEYVHAVKRGDNTLNIKTRIYMKVPSLFRGKSNPYLQIVAAFDGFKQEFYKE